MSSVDYYDKPNKNTGVMMPQDTPLPPQNMESTPSVFLYGICVCCSDCDSCLEAFCCARCQMSRQCNMMKNGEAEIDWMYCAGAFALDYFCTGGFAASIFVCQAREMMRKRYGIKGSACNDCCCALCCTRCVLQQQLLEMSSRGEFPGACCYEAPSCPSSAQMY